jgi:hypothetical protein
MNTCGTCRFFGPLEDALDDYSGDEDVPSTYHKCELLKHLNATYPRPTTEPAGVVDGSGYYAVLCVHEEFGCNQWQERPADEVTE